MMEVIQIKLSDSIETTKEVRIKNPYLKEGDIIYIGKHPLRTLNEIVTEFTTPFLGIYSTYKIFGFD